MEVERLKENFSGLNKVAALAFSFNYEIEFFVETVGSPSVIYLFKRYN